MSFFFILKESGFNWDLAKKVFYSLTDLQTKWINRMFKKESRRSRKAFGEEDKGYGTKVIKSFNLGR